jgi:uncharacterized protein YcbX
MSHITITRLRYYPIKSCAGVEAEAVTLDEQGIHYDRRWMLMQADTGRFLTQREHPRMAVIIPKVGEDGLNVTARGMPPLVMPHVLDTALRRVTATVWNFMGEVIDEGDSAADWFSEALGLPCRLVRTPEDFTRRVNPKYATPDDRVGFADGYPLLLASESSLTDLNVRLAQPIPMERFRPNVVVSGAPAWAEDRWSTLRVSDTGVSFRVAKPCDRCAMTTIDPATGERTGVEPLATLATFRRDAEGKVNFAMNLIHDWQGRPLTLRVGDVVEAK